MAHKIDIGIFIELRDHIGMKSLKGNGAWGFMNFTDREGTYFRILFPYGDIITFYGDGRSFLCLYGNSTLFRI